MRVVSRRLSLLTAASLVALSAPAGAADQGDVGIVDGTVRVVAIATIPGESWGADAECTYEAVIDDDVAFGVYEVDGTRMYSDTGRCGHRSTGRPLWRARPCGPLQRDRRPRVARRVWSGPRR